MKQSILTTLLLMLSLLMQAQIQDSLHRTVSPKGGINNLAVKYYGIDFTKEQRNLLKDKEIEFIFQVDESGIPTLSEVNGINDPAIIDSLQQKTNELPPFLPQITNGVPVPSIYFMQLVFPTYQLVDSNLGKLPALLYHQASIEDFEYIKKGNGRLDMLFSGMLNQFIGQPASYLATGGGMKVDISLTDKRQLLYGLHMNFYGNKLRKNYPLSTAREQFSAPPTLLVGAFFGKWFNHFNAQAELNFAVQNVTEKTGNNDPDWEQLNGWSLGIVANRPIPFGKEKTVYYYGSPSIFRNHLNLHAGLRYLSLSLKEASGFMFEIGLGYRLTIHQVESYLLKEGILHE